MITQLYSSKEEVERFSANGRPFFIVNDMTYNTGSTMMLLI